MFWLRPGDSRFASLVAASREHALTYANPGSTASDTCPHGFRRKQYESDLGASDQTWERAKEGLRRWAAHAGAGVMVHPHGAPLAEGEVVVVAIAAGPLVVAAPCRLVYVVDTNEAFGFAYGTLPGHPERGEESFIIHRHADHRISFTITSVSRPTGLAALGAPVTGAVQTRVTHRYLTAMEEYVRGTSPT